MSGLNAVANLLAFVGAILMVLGAWFSITMRSAQPAPPSWDGIERRRPGGSFDGTLPGKAYDGPERRKPPVKPKAVETAVSRFWGAPS
jgi:hypothetical protein